ncbi:MAG: hypothetical protein ACYTGC_16560 [Planctomycetota bacterium]|jgi:hypothetical protein
MTAGTTAISPSGRRAGLRAAPAMGLCVVVMLAVGVVLRLATDIAALGGQWDEGVMRAVVRTIVEGGWTVEHLLDYQDTKGPVFFWTYAALAEIVGAELNGLRWVSIGFFVASGLPLGLLAASLGLGVRRTGALAALLVLLPYHGVLGQLFMSEPSFLFGSLLIAVVFVHGLSGAATAADAHRPAALGPLVFGVLVAVLLHHRVHVVAMAGAAVLVATWRDGWRSWPWWVAAFVAGLARLPLYLRWGGFVGSEYQDVLGLGLRLTSLTYLLIAALPCTAVMVWPALAEPRWRRRWPLLAAGAVAGGGLGLLAVPDVTLPTSGQASFMGVAATTLRPLAEHTTLLTLAVTSLAALGGTALTATVLVGLDGEGDRHEGRAVILDRLAVITLLLGWSLYGLTRGVVFDRYLLPFVVLLPVLWVRRLPGWLLALQALGLATILGRLTLTWLMGG